MIAEPFAVKIGYKYFILPDGKNAEKIIKKKAEVKTQRAFYGV
jgi:hypothetical protein